MFGFLQILFDNEKKMCNSGERHIFFPMTNPPIRSLTIPMLYNTIMTELQTSIFIFENLSVLLSEN